MTRDRLIIGVALVVLALAVVSTVRSWNYQPYPEPDRVAVAEVQCTYDCTTPQTEIVDEQCSLDGVTAVRLTVERSNGYRVTREIDCLEGDDG